MVENGHLRHRPASIRHSDPAALRGQCASPNQDREGDSDRVFCAILAAIKSGHAILMFQDSGRFRV